MTEDDPLRAFRFPFRPDAPPPGGIGDDPFADYDKIILEEASRSDGRFETSIIRAPMIFGPGDRQHRFKWAIDAVDAAPTGGTIELDERAARWPASYAYITDIAEAIVLAATAPAAAGRIYNVGQPFVRNALEWLLSFAAVMQKPLEVLTVPAARRGLLADQADGANLDYPLTVDSSRIRAELGFAEIVPEREALLATIAVERAQRPH